MNFSILFLLLLFTSCGLKTKLKPPQGESLPSIEQGYNQSYSQKPDEEKKKEKSDK